MSSPYDDFNADHCEALPKEPRRAVPAAAPKPRAFWERRVAGRQRGRRGL